MPPKVPASLKRRIAAVPLLLPPAARGRLREWYKAIVPQPAFALAEAIDWLASLKRHGIAFGFPDDLAHGPTARAAQPIAILKHDIHDDLDRAVNMARAEHGQSIRGLYFMMGPHPLNRKFYGTARAWDQLRAIQSLGHRIGLHLDAFGALRKGGVYDFVARTVEEFSRHGIALRYGNSHGDRKYRALGLRTGDLFVERGRQRQETAKAVSWKLAPHLGAYSLKHLAKRFGLQYWVDSSVFCEGVALQPTLYVTDNSGSIRIPAKGVSSRRFEIDAGFVAASLPLLASSASLILLHPQWYAGERRG